MRKGNRGKNKPRVINPVRQTPLLYDCPKHGMQRGAGIISGDIKICNECIFEFLQDNCCELIPLGEKPKAT